MMKKNTIRTVVMGLSVCVLALFIGSCSEPVGGMGKSPVYLTADGGSKWGMVIDVYNSSLKGGVSDEYFDITIKSNYKNPALTTEYADVVLQEYTVTYYRVDGKAVPTPFSIQIMTTVPGGGSYTMNTLVLKRDAKLRSPLKDLVFGGGEGSIEFNAIIDFYGEDMMGNNVTARYIMSINASDM